MFLTGTGRAAGASSWAGSPIPACAFLIVLDSVDTFVNGLATADADAIATAYVSSTAAIATTATPSPSN